MAPHPPPQQILSRAGWGRAVLLYVAVGIPQVILLGQQGLKGPMAVLGLSTRLGSGILGVLS